MYRNWVLQCRFRSNLNPTQIWPLYQVLLGEKIFWGESPVCQTMIEGLETGEQSPNARTGKRVSVGMPHTNCVLRTCFVPQTAVLVRRGRRRAHLRLGRTQCSPRALCASIDPRGSDARPREAKRGGVEPHGASRWASRCRRHLGRRSLGPFARSERRESLRVRQLVARSLRSRRARVNGGGGGREGEAARTRSPLEAPSDAISARWIVQ